MSRFARLRTRDAGWCLFNVDQIHGVIGIDRPKPLLFFVGDDEDADGVILDMPAAEACAAIEAATRGESAPCPSPPADPPATPEPEPEPAGPIPLAVGQVWGCVAEFHSGGRTLATIRKIDDGRVYFESVNPIGERWDVSLKTPSFRSDYPILISPAPPPAPADPVALLAEGKRLRYVRGADGLDLPGEAKAEIRAEKHSHRGLFWGGGNPLPFVTTWGVTHGVDEAAKEAHLLATRLGYRFDRVIGDDD